MTECKFLDKTFASFFKKSVLSGTAIAFCAYLKGTIDDANFGNFLFSFGLVVVLASDWILYTGSIHNVFSKESIGWIKYAIVLLGNVVGVALLFVAVKASGFSTLDYPIPKIDSLRSFSNVFFRGAGCGTLMTTAVLCWRKHGIKSAPIAMFCVFSFLTCGFYHCVVVAYWEFSNATSFHWNDILFLSLVVLGNTFGSVVVKRLSN